MKHDDDDYKWQDEDGESLKRGTANEVTLMVNKQKGALRRQAAEEKFAQEGDRPIMTGGRVRHREAGRMAEE